MEPVTPAKTATSKVIMVIGFGLFPLLGVVIGVVLGILILRLMNAVESGPKPDPAIKQSLVDEVRELRIGREKLEKEIVVLRSEQESRHLKEIRALRAGLEGRKVEAPLSQDGVRLARESKAKGDNDLAALYYLNAINHAPADAELLKEYGDFVLKDEKTATEKFRRLHSVLEVSIYQVDPESVASLLALIKNVQMRQNQFTDGPIAQPINPGWQTQLDVAMAVKFDDLWQDEHKLSDHLEALAGLLDSAADSDAPDQSKIDQITKLLAVGKIILTASSVAKVLDQTCTNLEGAVESVPEKALSIIQTAEGLLGQLWGLDLSKLPQALSAKINAYPQKIRFQLDKMESAKCMPLVNRIKELKDGALGVSTSFNLQHRYSESEKHLKEAIPLYQQLSQQAAREKADAFLAEIRAHMDSVRQQQIMAYQKWTIIKINNAFDAYMQIKVVTENDAKKIFEDNGLSEINPSLLKQDTATMMNDVTGKLIAEMSGKTAFEAFKKMAETTKKTLEDF